MQVKMIEITMKTMKLILRLQKQLLKYSGRRTKIANIQKISDVCCAVNHILLLSVISDQVYVVVIIMMVIWIKWYKIER